MKVVLLIVFFGVGPNGDVYHDTAQIPMASIEVCEKAQADLAEVIRYPSPNQDHQSSSSMTSFNTFCIEVEE